MANADAASAALNGFPTPGSTHPIPACDLHILKNAGNQTAEGKKAMTALARSPTESTFAYNLGKLAKIVSAPTLEYVKNARSQFATVDIIKVRSLIIYLQFTKSCSHSFKLPHCRPWSRDSPISAT